MKEEREVDNEMFQHVFITITNLCQTFFALVAAFSNLPSIKFLMNILYTFHVSKKRSLNM